MKGQPGGPGCEGPILDWAPCNTIPCPFWSEWADEYETFEKCGMFCQRTRTRECQNVDLYDQPAERLCLGPKEMRAGCDTCGKWTEWRQD